MDAAARRSYVEWTHAAQDVASIVRDYTNWVDDAPTSLQHFAESLGARIQDRDDATDGSGGFGL